MILAKRNKISFFIDLAKIWSNVNQYERIFGLSYPQIHHDVDRQRGLGVKEEIEQVEKNLLLMGY